MIVKRFEGYLLLESSISLVLLTFLVLTIVPLLVFINNQREIASNKMELARFFYEESELIRQNKTELKEKQSGKYIMSGECVIDKNQRLVLTVRGKGASMVVVSEGKK